MANIDDLFGTDSDDDDDFAPKARPAAEAQKQAQQGGPEDAAEEMQEEDGAQAQQADCDDGFKDDFKDSEPERPVGPPLSLDAPRVRRLRAPCHALKTAEGGDTRLVRLSNILNIETRHFDPATHEPAEAEVVVDDSGKRRVRLRDQNVIRWRWRGKPDAMRNVDLEPEAEGDEKGNAKLKAKREPDVESNARFVRWSDGSMQLLVGDEALDCSVLDMAGDHHFLFLRHIQAQLLEAQGRFEEKLVFRPASLNSRYHRRLAQAVDKSHTKAHRVRKWNAVADPAREKADREKAEEARIRASEQLERRQHKEMRRYAAPPRPERRGAASGLTAQYLETVEDAYETDEEDGGGGPLSATERARRNLQRRPADDDREAEERLARAKRAAPPPPRRAPAPPAKRQATEGSDLDLDDLSADDDEDDVRAARTQHRGRQRGLVLSDDDED